MMTEQDKEYTLLEHMGDAYIEVNGETLKEAFQRAAIAVFDVMTDVSLIEHKLVDDICIEANDVYTLLHDWLSTLLIRFETEMKVYSRFDVKIFKGEKIRLEAKAYGEHFNKSRHPSKTEVKAVTYHRMEVIEAPRKVTLRFILDL